MKLFRGCELFYRCHKRWQSSDCGDCNHRLKFSNFFYARDRISSKIERQASSETGSHRPFDLKLRMGCCVSSDNSHCHFPRSPSTTHEEEAVKEVLTETPISKQLPPSVIFQEKVELEAMVATAEEVSQISGVSEVCGEGFKEKNGNEGNRNEDDGVVTQMMGRSPPKARTRRPCSGDISGGSDRGGWDSPRRLEGVNRVPSKTARSPSAGRRNGGLLGVGESGRRSKAPVIASELGAACARRGKSSPSITAGMYSIRQPALAAEDGCAFEKSNGCDSPTATETLENPLVSLECFIFL